MAVVIGGQVLGGGTVSTPITVTGGGAVAVPVYADNAGVWMVG